MSAKKPRDNSDAAEQDSRGAAKGDAAQPAQRELLALHSARPEEPRHSLQASKLSTEVGPIVQKQSLVGFLPSGLTTVPVFGESPKSDQQASQARNRRSHRHRLAFHLMKLCFQVEVPDRRIFAVEVACHRARARHGRRQGSRHRSKD